MKGPPKHPPHLPPPPPQPKHPKPPPPKTNKPKNTTPPPPPPPTHPPRVNSTSISKLRDLLHPPRGATRVLLSGIKTGPLLPCASPPELSNVEGTLYLFSPLPHPASIMDAPMCRAITFHPTNQSATPRSISFRIVPHTFRPSIARLISFPTLSQKKLPSPADPPIRYPYSPSPTTFPLTPSGSFSLFHFPPASRSQLKCLPQVFPVFAPTLKYALSLFHSSPIPSLTGQDPSGQSPPDPFFLFPFSLSSVTSGVIP